jgi:hypothetical protein
MSEDPVDLSSLDPDNDPSAADQFVSAVLRRVDARGRPRAPDAFVGVWALWRPLLVAAAAMLAILARDAVRGRAPQPAAARTVAEAVGIPPEFLNRMQNERGGVR